MYDPQIGRWMEEDPEGFAAGDSNLYRYVNNRPTVMTDPSGLQETMGPARPNGGPPAPPPATSWDFWTTRPQQALNISGQTDGARVREALGSLDTTFNLNEIPWVDPFFPITANHMSGRQVPSFPTVTVDNAGIYYSGLDWTQGRRTSSVTPAQLARINLRVNLLSLKQSIVTQIYLMLRNTPPAPMGDHPIPTYGDFARAANETADVFIRATDDFLRTHPGARPALGARNGIADGLGIENPQNAPWCGDWAPAMHNAIHEALRNGRMSTTAGVLSFDHGQASHPNGAVIFDLEHNFIIVRPYGYQTRFSTVGGSFVDPVVLMFDPWRELLPKVYRPIPWTEEPRRTPTNNFPRQQVLQNDPEVRR